MKEIKRIKNYLDLSYDIEMLKAEIRLLRKQRREIEFQIGKLSGAPASYPAIQYQDLKIDRKYSAPPKLEAVWGRLEEINKELDAKERDLKALEYRKKKIDVIIEKMDRPKNKVAILREIQGKTLAEIADELGYSESHVKRLSAEISQEIYGGKMIPG